MDNFYRLIKFAIKQTTVITCLLICCGAVLSQNTAEKVLSPDKFVGKVSLGYKAAQAIPEVCSKLFCYCGCDLTENHTSLLDCFTCMHGVDCDICQDEAIVALHLKEQGKSLSEIQKTIDDGFANQYPWDKPSPALIKYRETFKINHPQSITKSGITSINKLARPGKCCGHQ